MNKPIILYGKKVADEILSNIPNQNGKELAIITIGDDDASKVYVRNKIKAAERVGLKGVNYKFDSLNAYYEVSTKIEELNIDSDVVGIMVQKPYPDFLNGIENFITPAKDVDGLHPDNLGTTCMGRMPFYYPATPDGILTLLDYYNIPIEGKNVVIIGRSDIVGKPLAAMMTARNATVTLCHSKTKNLREYTRMANIIISAVGKPKYLDSSYITTTYPDHDGRPHKISLKFPTIIDVGTCRDQETGKLCGDVDFNDVLPYCGAITPNPKGVGPMTIALLIKHCTK